MHRVGRAKGPTDNENPGLGHLLGKSNIEKEKRASTFKVHESKNKNSFNVQNQN